jgi:DNA polymerase-3 subunit alpha
MEWNEIKQFATEQITARSLDEAYAKRLLVELKEIEKQGANSFWVRQINEKITYETNKNGLVLPYIMGLTPVDPLQAQHKFELQSDWPDIDIDCLPEARDPIKNYIANKYGEEYVCSVGTWQTYKFRSAIQDVVRGIGGDVRETIAMTTQLPDSVDDLKDQGIAPCVDCATKHADAVCPKCGSEQIDGITIGKLLKDYIVLSDYNALHPDHVDLALRMVGKIKALGTHAGGVIISSKPLFGNIPMARVGGRWNSMWTEGRNTQLSKFGFVKWDVLGLKTLQYIYDCCAMIKKTRGIVFDPMPWARYDRTIGRLGLYKMPDGTEKEIRMDDSDVFDMLNDLRTETVFQFETDVQRGILSNGVRDYYDLQVFNAMGHPGPMEMIPEYVKRRAGGYLKGADRDARDRCLPRAACQHLAKVR